MIHLNELHAVEFELLLTALEEYSYSCSDATVAKKTIKLQTKLLQQIEGQQDDN